MKKIKVIEKVIENKNSIVEVSTNKAKETLAFVLRHKHVIKSIVKLGNRFRRTKVNPLYVLKTKHVIGIHVHVKSFRGYSSHWSS